MLIIPAKPITYDGNETFVLAFNFNDHSTLRVRLHNDKYMLVLQSTFGVEHYNAKWWELQRFDTVENAFNEANKLIAAFEDGATVYRITPTTDQSQSIKTENNEDIDGQKALEGIEEIEEKIKTIPQC